ncbi:MAG TPA: hypothetical protein VNU03_05555, partial [Methylomirabilota bacterium]|nr:hypothetical protein [Methylomirabilota bacterium]
MTRAWLPPTLLAAYAIAFGWRALGGGLLVFDDHPGQLYRVVQAITVGLAPWRFDPGWWAGYAELQYYPPGFAWLGALLHHAAGGALSAATVYQALLWLAWVLPGAATYVLLRRLLGDPWLALPGALVALTLSAGCRSGVEEGLRWGLVGARLGWGALSLQALVLLRWAEGAPRPPLGAAGLVAAVTLLHPAHTSTAVAMVLLAAAWRAPRRRRLVEGLALVALGLGLAGVWLLPLLAHLDMALPLAWQDRSLPVLGWRVISQPVLPVLALLGLIAWRSSAPGREARGRWLLAMAPLTIGLVLVDALVAEPLGAAWLPADRLVDGLHWALVLGGALGVAALGARLARPRVVVPLALAACVPLAWGPYEPGLSLWPWAGQWPKEQEVTRGLRLDALWPALQAAPPGRILFVRSGVSLDWRPEWWRPHTHLTALTPIRTGRAIVGGTFTHPSPVAGLIYTGSAANRPLTLLAEQLDGRTLFGVPLEALGAETFDRLAARLGISTVVAMDEDAGVAPFLVSNPALRRTSRIGSFNVFVFRDSREDLTSIGPQRWQVPVSPDASGWAGLAIAFSPLWVARAGGTRIPTRRDALGLLEVMPPAGTTVVELEHRAGAAEWAGVAVSLLSLSALGLLS